jgi:hypothetical protein
MTAQRDAGPAALRTALLALDRPSEVPQFVRFQSANLTLSQYAACFEKISGQPINLVKQDWQDARFEYLERQGFCNKFEVLGTYSAGSIVCLRVRVWLTYQHRLAPAYCHGRGWA